MLILNCTDLLLILTSYFTNEESEAQRDLGTCLKVTMLLTGKTNFLTPNVGTYHITLCFSVFDVLDIYRVHWMSKLIIVLCRNSYFVTVEATECGAGRLGLGGKIV